MKVALFEVCRRPEVFKPNSEAIVLSACFESLGIDLALYSNDAYWTDRPKAGSVIDKEIIGRCLEDPDLSVVHFAVHGSATALILGWEGDLGQRVEANLLTGPQIRAMSGFRNRLIVSGACGSGGLADDFLSAGADALLAPDLAVPWRNLGAFFRLFYGSIKAGTTPQVALESARSGYPEFGSYRIHAR
jgi:hypothetical protein